MGKRLKLLLPILMICSTSMLAQLKVYPDGSMSIDRDTLMEGCRLAVGGTFTSIANMITGVSGKTGGAFITTPMANKYNFGLIGSSVNTTLVSSGRSYGVMGSAGNCTSGYNYGVFGSLIGTGNGAGVYGAVNNPKGNNVSGQYAGYFQGDVRITGTATIASVNTPSDIRLKDNIRYVGDGESRHDIHSRLMDVHVISYNLKNISNEVGDTAKSESLENEECRKTRYGVSAQELRDLFPNLVEEGQDGYLSVNYMELVPMLICSVQELQREVSRLRGEEDRHAENFDSSEEGKEPYQSMMEQSALYQNTPNPSTTQTVIRYKLPSTAAEAYIYILNLQGTLLRQIPVTPSLDSVTVSLSGFDPGIYLYSLIVAGHEIDTKRMIIAR